MGLPLPSFIPMPPAPPSGSSPTGSTGIAVTFPDGQTAILSANALVKPAFPATSLTIGSIAYVPTDASEMAGMLSEINAAIQIGSTLVVLNSTAAMPGSADFLAAIPATGLAFAPTDIVVSLTAPAANAAPAKSFRTDGVFLLGGRACTTRFINVFTVILTTPPLAAGAVALQYSDSRGSVQVATYYTYT